MVMYKPKLALLICSETYVLRFTDPCHKVIQLRNSNEGIYCPSSTDTKRDGRRVYQHEEKLFFIYVGTSGVSPSAFLRISQRQFSQLFTCLLPVSTGELPNAKSSKGPKSLVLVGFPSPALFMSTPALHTAAPTLLQTMLNNIQTPQNAMVNDDNISDGNQTLKGTH